jgi:hypothetical protein
VPPPVVVELAPVDPLPAVVPRGVAPLEQATNVPKNVRLTVDTIVFMIFPGVSTC